MRRLLVVVLLAATLAACESSKLDRAAGVVVSGRVLAADGSPAGGAPVALVREPSIGEVFAGLVFVPLTFGLACLGQAPAAGLCRGRALERTVTRADGTYSLSLTGRDTQTAFGNAVDFTLSTAVAGASVTADFKIQTENLALPDLQAWQPAVSVAPGRVGWSPPAPGSYQVVVEDGAGQLVWTFDSARPEVAFDPRVLEDAAGKLAVSAVTKAGAEGTTVTVRRQSAPVDYRSAAGPPPSRGRPCTAGAPAVPVTPCPLTDGNFTNELPRPATTTSTTAAGTAVAETATIDLGRPADVSLIVVRGCTCQVERSSDGSTWTAAGRSTGHSIVVPARSGPARYIRLTGSLSQLREVSVWEGAPPVPPPAGSPPAAAAAPAPAPAVVPVPVDAPTESRTGPALIALALLVLVAVGTAAGVVVARRR